MEHMLFLWEFLVSGRDSARQGWPPFSLPHQIDCDFRPHPRPSSPVPFHLYPIPNSPFFIRPPYVSHPWNANFQSWIGTQSANSSPFSAISWKRKILFLTANPSSENNFNSFIILSPGHLSLYKQIAHHFICSTHFILSGRWYQSTFFSPYLEKTICAQFFKTFPSISIIVGILKINSLPFQLLSWTSIVVGKTLSTEHHHHQNTSD